MKTKFNVLAAGVFLAASLSSVAQTNFTRITTGDIVNDQRHWHGQTWGDYDNDGDLDVLLTGAGYPTSSRPLALYRNEAGGHFRKMTQGDIGALAAEVANSYGCTWGDYDNDGWVDLIIANGWFQSEQRKPLIYHNQGDGTSNVGRA